MQLASLHDKGKIEAFVRRDPLLYIYELGDLDDFFWPHTAWYAWQDAGQDAGQDTGKVRQMALLYYDLSLPVLLAHAAPPQAEMRELLQALLPLLPRRFYAHLDPQMVDVLSEAYQVQAHGLYYKIGLRDPSALAAVDTSQVIPLSVDDIDLVETLYREAYPGNWFVPRMLQTGCYYGIRQGPDLVSIAGVHVYAPEYKVAAVGNVTTRTEMRGRGLGTAVCAHLCRALRRQGIEHIGLNVNSANAAAITSYTRLGFQQVAVYGEYTLETRC
ncbi:MAG: GNAT family N-acetyltransferase [Chloroflexi bacterium]|nr:GNAT family N-acetyltransferase [Chloroflexota bacterium]